MLFIELNEINGVEGKVSFIMNLPVSNLENSDGITFLKKKLKSELNTISSCILPFVNSKELELTKKETIELKKRVENISTKLYESNRYTLLKTTDGIAPVYGVGMDTIANKKVAVVYLGGDCTIDETDLKWEKITTVFNTKMRVLLKK